MEKLKSPRLSFCHKAEFVSNFNNTSKYESDVEHSMESLISSSWDISNRHMNGIDYC
jgi:hypothetical protein